MGMDEWVRGFRFITYADCFDGQHHRVFSPPRESRAVFPFQTYEDMISHQLHDPRVLEHIRSRGPGRIAMMLFDDEAESICADLQQQVIFPSVALRRRVDDKVEATRLGDKAGVPSVPNALGRVRTWEDLQALAGHLGPDLVIQTPFGDSGITTFFVSTREDFEAVQPTVAAEAEVKVMRRIRCAQAAVEGCVTKAGTIVGPVMTEIVGFSELTPYRGGWAGNEVAPEAFTSEQRALASKRTQAFGEVLRGIGWRGYFEIDWLVDLDTGELYLGEVNPRITGASPLTNLAAVAHADAPLFLFHLLEYSDIPFTLDVDEINERWTHPVHADPWGQLILKHVGRESVEITGAPGSGAWEMKPDGSVAFHHLQTHRRTVDDESRAFFLRLAQTGDIVDNGDDIGVLVMRGRLMTDERTLTERTSAWNRGIRDQFSAVPHRG